MTTATIAKPWYREFWPWFLMAGPFLAMLGCFITMYFAFTQFSNQPIQEEGLVKRGLVIEHQERGGALGGRPVQPQRTRMGLRSDVDPVAVACSALDLRADRPAGRGHIRARAHRRTGFYTVSFFVLWVMAGCPARSRPI